MISNRGIRRPGPARPAAGTIGLVVLLALAGCVSEDATPIGDVTTTETTPHLLAPSDQMRELAEQQCRDDPELEQGEVNAVDPADPDKILASVTVDCAEIETGQPTD